MRVYFYVILSWFLRLDAFAPIERSLEEKMLKGDAIQGASVRIETTRWGLLFSGWIRAATVELEGLRIGGLRVRRFHIHAMKFRIHPFSVFVRNKVRLREAGEARWTMEISSEDLEAFFASRGGLWRNTRVNVDEGMITVSMAGQFADLIRVSPFTLRGGLRLREDGHIDLDLDDVRAFGVTPGRAIIGSLLTLVNPVVRAGAINRLLRQNAPEMFEPFVLHNTVTEVVMRDGAAIVSGEVFTFHREAVKQEDEG